MTLSIKVLSRRIKLKHRQNLFAENEYATELRGNICRNDNYKIKNIVFNVL